MKLSKALDILERHYKCLKCGNDRVGGGEGKLVIGSSHMLRSCKCGYKVIIKEDEQ